MIYKPYMRLYSELNGSVFTKEQAQKVLGTSVGASAVVLNRLKKEHAVFQPERASYRLMKPENQVRLAELGWKEKKLRQLVVELYKSYPLLSMLLLYGSRVRGDADELSDYDVLVVLPVPSENKSSVKKTIEKKLGIRMHLTVYSEHTYENALMMEPYIRMWLSEGMIFGEGNISRIIIPPAPKIAYKEMMYSVETLIEVADAERNTGNKGEYYLKALNMLLMIGNLLDLDYDYKKTKQKLEGILGQRVINSIRHSKKISKEDLNMLKKKTTVEYKKILKKVNAIGENESDIRWRGMLK